MKAILATRISFMIIAHNLLPKTHFCYRQKLFIEEAIHNFLKKIHAAWNKNEIASLLIIDVFAAYSNTSHKGLLYKLCKK